VALVEYGTSPTMRILDAKTGGSIPIPGTASGLFPSWRPNVNTSPPYQFVYSDGNVLKIASVAGAILGVVHGADDPSRVQTQPAWGPNGQIAFVRGTPDGDAGVFEIVGPADLLVVPEGGGTAVPVTGASGNGGDNYYPEFSPNGKYIAYTFSASGQTTKSATDSVIKLVTADNTGQIVNLPQLNATGPNSWPIWAMDGSFLSFSSTRAGGKGSSDVYFAPVDQNSGADGPATPLTAVNTFNFDHNARWAFLPP
jgi:Tol biopolymer transport system component